MQRGEAVRLDGLRQSQGALLGGRWHGVAVCIRHRAYLGHQAAECLPGDVYGADLPDRQPHRRGRAGLRANEGELPPQHRLDARRQLRLETGPRAAGQQALGPVADAAVQLPDCDAGRPASVHDHARLGDPGKDESSPAHHVIFADRAGEFLLVLDAVLQRHHRRVLTHQWPQPGRGGVGIEGLDAEQHKSHGPTSAGSSVAGTCTWKSPLTLRTRSPRSRRACR